MSGTASHLAEDLSPLVRGTVAADPLTLALYASDASLWEVRPIAVVCPRDHDDVVTVVRYAREQGLPILPRGAGTNRAGSGLGPGIVLDFSRFMHAIEAIGESTVRAQAGVSLERLSAELAAHGLYLPPAPLGNTTTTLGGMLGVDVVGPRALGSLRDYVASLEIVTAGGACFEVGQEPRSALLRSLTPLSGSVDQTAAEDSLQADPRASAAEKQMLLVRLERFLERNGECLSDPAGRFLPFGTDFPRILTREALDVPRLLVGSEGTLALFTAATLRVEPLPAERGAMLVAFSSLDAAIAATTAIGRESLVACDLLDRRLLTLARETDQNYARMIPVSAEAALLLEWHASSPRGAESKRQAIRAAIAQADEPGQITEDTTLPAAVNFLWSLPQTMLPLLQGMGRSVRPAPIVEDLRLPRENVSEFVTQSQRVLQQFGLTATLYGHLLTGHLRLRPFLPALREIDLTAVDELSQAIHEIAWACGGSLRGGHGIGMTRGREWTRLSAPSISAWRELRQLCDPEGRLNPGNLVCDLDAVPAPALRRSPREPRLAPGAPPPMASFGLSWASDEFSETAESCNGCGGCRTNDPQKRMCPFFRVESAEEFTPRAKANALRNLFSGEFEPHVLTTPEFESLAQSCFNCKQCHHECPTRVDVPRLMLETKAQQVALRGLSWAEWLVTRATLYGNWYNYWSRWINPLWRNSWTRRLIARLTGVADLPAVPRWAARSFLETMDDECRRPPLEFSTPRPVVYFVDHFANHHAPQIAEAFVRIVRMTGRSVYVPPRQITSGMAFLSAGDLERARRVATVNVNILAEFARAGCPIVCTEPSAAVCLKQEYPRLLSHPDAQEVASQVIEAGQFLEQLQASGEWSPTFRPLSVAARYHQPCHLRTLQVGTLLPGGRNGEADDETLSWTAVASPFAQRLSQRSPLWELCRQIPGVTGEVLETGCSGMAGAYGLIGKNATTAAAIGQGLTDELTRTPAAMGLSECGACRIRMAGALERPPLHPLQLLAAACGVLDLPR